MIYAVKLGPIETGEGRRFVYVAIRDDGFLLRPRFGGGDKAGMAALAAEARPGEPLLCESKLARVGASLGFSAAPLPDWAAEVRAELALGMHLGPMATPEGRDEMALLCRSGAEFLRAKPWRYWTDNTAIALTVGGAMHASFEGALMGAAGMEFGIALYRVAGAVKRIERAMDAGDQRAALREAAIAVTFDAEPKWVVGALRDAYGLARIPAPVELSGGAMVPVGPTDIAILAASLHLLAAVRPNQRDASVGLPLGDGGEGITIAIAMPAPNR